MSLFISQGLVSQRVLLVEKLNVLLQILPNRVIHHVLPSDLLLERLEHSPLLHDSILMISPLQLINLLGLQYLYLLLLNNNVPESLLHLPAVHGQLVLPPVLLLHGRPRTVIPLKAQGQLVTHVLAALRQGVVRFLPTAINEGGFFDDTLEGSGVLRFPLRMVAS